MIVLMLVQFCAQASNILCTLSFLLPTFTSAVSGTADVGASTTTVGQKEGEEEAEDQLATLARQNSHPIRLGSGGHNVDTQVTTTTSGRRRCGIPMPPPPLVTTPYRTGGAGAAVGVTSNSVKYNIGPLR